MRVTLVAVGRMKAGPAQELYELYARRLRWRITLKEVEERRSLPSEALKQQEGALILAALPRGARTVALDEGGREMTSRDFAAQLGRWQDEGTQDLAFVIGGADGLSDAVRGAADLILSLGRLTWPHMLVRGLVAEQLFRAESILAGHPYHRD
ncbi:MAG: 23S rRNA (pseudouridine(1915)-N(3))-methyltransferase RlmH [Kiloniellaceae bacterium]